MVFGFMEIGMLASALLGVTCGYLSVYVVLKRLVFLAVALAQIASASVALALLWGGNPTLAALIGVVLGAMGLAWAGHGRYLPRENAIGAGYALASSAGVVLIAKSARGEEHLLNLMYGNVLTVQPAELWLMGGFAVVMGAIFLIFGKEILCSSFDPEVARTLGIRTGLWEGIFYLALGVLIALAIRLGGMLLAFALLVLPGYAVLLARSGMRGALGMAPILGVAAGVAGLVLSYRWDLPTSALTVLLLGGVVAGGAGIGWWRSRGRG